MELSNKLVPLLHNYYIIHIGEDEFLLEFNHSTKMEYIHINLSLIHVLFSLHSFQTTFQILTPFCQRCMSFRKIEIEILKASAQKHISGMRLETYLKTLILPFALDLYPWDLGRLSQCPWGHSRIK